MRPAAHTKEALLDNRSQTTCHRGMLKATIDMTEQLWTVVMLRNMSTNPIGE